MISYTIYREELPKNESDKHKTSRKGTWVWKDDEKEAVVGMIVPQTDCETPFSLFPEFWALYVQFSRMIYWYLSL